MVLSILNLEGHQNCMISSKVTSISLTFFHPADEILRVKMCLLMRELAGEGLWLWLLALVTPDM